MFWLLIVNNLNIVNYSYDVDFQYHSIKITEYWEQYVKLMGVSQLYIYKLHSEKTKKDKGCHWSGSLLSFKILLCVLFGVNTPKPFCQVLVKCTFWKSTAPVTAFVPFFPSVALWYELIKSTVQLLMHIIIIIIHLQSKTSKANN